MLRVDPPPSIASPPEPLEAPLGAPAEAQPGLPPAPSAGPPEGSEPQPPPGRRDDRLDLFRGLAQWFIFLDHIPDNFANWFTVVNFGFSDAAEIFVFASGYAAVLAYSRVMERSGWLFAAARIVRRAWQLYLVHLTLFVLFAAQVFRFAAVSDDEEVIDQMNLTGLADEPGRAMLEAALLRFQPTNLDILPVYILFLLAFPLVLPLVRRAPWWTLAASVLLYAVSRHYGWNLAAYPDGKTWYFDPLAWQLLFVLGATFASVGNLGERLRPIDGVLFPAAVLFVLLAIPIALSWQIEWLEQFIPNFVNDILHPLDKTKADPLRVIHFLALVYLAQRLVRPDAAYLRSRLLDPLRMCGKHSLKVFAIGILLSFAARTFGDYTEDSNLAELAVSVAGLAILCLIAYTAEWYRNRERTATKSSSSSAE